MSFFLSKFLWLFFNPLSLIFFIFFLGCTFLFFNKYKFAKIIFFTNFIFFSTIIIFPIGGFALYILEKDYHTKIVYPKKIHGILILSGATSPYLSNEHNSVELNSSSERLTETIVLMNKYKDAKVIFSGGSGNLNTPLLTHSNVAKNFFSRMGVDVDRIIFENKSRNTYENIIYSKKISKITNNQNWIMITSASHMKRASLISTKQNWKIYPYPVDFRQPKKFSLKPSLNFYDNLNSFNHASHEWLGLLSYYFMGRTEKVF
tara:strand:+ start:1421 stop:2203 length:783 start_codon:yes stop_codon:yes gene_type:complete